MRRCVKRLRRQCLTGLRTWSRIMTMTSVLRSVPTDLKVFWHLACLTSMLQVVSVFHLEAALSAI